MTGKQLVDVVRALSDAYGLRLMVSPIRCQFGYKGGGGGGGGSSSTSMHVYVPKPWMRP